MSSAAPSSTSDNVVASSSTTTTTTTSATNSDGTFRRKLETNRFTNQQKRRDWETRKEESIAVCREYIGDFVKCTEGRTFSVLWHCRPHNSWMTECMKTYMVDRDGKAALLAGKKIKEEYLASHPAEK